MFVQGRRGAVEENGHHGRSGWLNLVRCDDDYDTSRPSEDAEVEDEDWMMISDSMIRAEF
jgi:hypothetical protein